MVSALAATMIDIDHLKYVRAHNLAHRAVVFSSIVVMLSFILEVWGLWTLKA